MSSKLCSHCYRYKPYECFSRNRSRPDGYAHRCKQCEASQKKYAWRSELLNRWPVVEGYGE